MAYNYSYISDRLKNPSKEHPYVTGSIDIFDDKHQKSQDQINDILEASIQDEIARAQYHENLLQALYNGLTQSDIIAGPLPSSGVANIIYRVPGEGNYTDYMWDGTQFVPMATYDNAIDDTPTPDSLNLITSGGVDAAIKAMRTNIVEHDSNTAEIAPEVFNVWGPGNNFSEITITFGEGIEGIANEYKIKIYVEEDHFQLHIPSSIKWVNDFPDFDKGAVYEISILDGIAVYYEYYLDN